MCGICGIAGPSITEQDLKVFKDLLYVSALRGDHSTGVAAIKTGEDWGARIRKDVVSSDYFLWEDEISKSPIISGTHHHIFMGHCRHATAGDITAENSHPFETETLIGTHNGTLDDVEFWDKVKTDSELMFQKMDSHGVIPVLDELDAASAFAVAVWLKGTDSLILSRNEHRPLHIALNKDRGVLYYASEAEMLTLCLNRRSIRHDLYTLLPYKLYEFSMEWIRKQILDDDTVFEYHNMTDKTGLGKKWWEDYRYSWYPNGSSSQTSTKRGKATYMGKEVKEDAFEDIGEESVEKSRESGKWDKDKDGLPWQMYECDFCGCEMTEPELDDSDRYFARQGDLVSKACRSCLPVMAQMAGVSCN